ncbi:hypothetical protein CERSUDRAFT_122551 [Gelatoporia subvermispora B]|uniref:Uncharacterized protein n=1 Tax=Ceriporiopsis subvermispora (strain B) TaxID=914234 RepID=M2R3I1_CERS8|nr:hypothetical protein CERSUDRAFT_122551 [Gelatoporia subvermispora B]
MNKNAPSLASLSTGLFANMHRREKRQVVQRFDLATNSQRLRAPAATQAPASRGQRRPQNAELPERRVYRPKTYRSDKYLARNNTSLAMYQQPDTMQHQLRLNDTTIWLLRYGPELDDLVASRQYRVAVGLTNYRALATVTRALGWGYTNCNSVWIQILLIPNGLRKGIRAVVGGGRALEIVAAHIWEGIASSGGLRFGGRPSDLCLRMEFGPVPGWKIWSSAGVPYPSSAKKHVVPGDRGGMSRNIQRTTAQIELNPSACHSSVRDDAAARSEAPKSDLAESECEHSSHVTQMQDQFLRNFRRNLALE